nr:hypothetical protein BaRGS_012634 [Batillaria attramentaria]
MMASGMTMNMTALVASVPPQEEFLIYDIRGDLSSDDVLAAFSGFNVTYKFKTLSGRRFVVGDDLATFKAHMKALGEEFIRMDNIVQPRIFHITAMVPSKAWGFTSIPAYLLDRIHLEGDIVFSGPYQTKVVITPIVNIY